jgi:PrtD family type I secretion system ABC transporter
MNERPSQFAETVGACRTALIAVGAFSAVINLLLLTGALYTLQVFDRVLSSRSWDTLFYLTLIAGIAILVQTVLDAIRGRIATRIGAFIERRLGEDGLLRAVNASIEGKPYRSEVFRDLGRLKQFLGGNAVFSAFDVPWTPIYLLVIFLIHPLLGWIALAAALLLIGFAVVNELATRKPIENASKEQSRIMRRMGGITRNAEVVDALGMTGRIGAAWSKENERALAWHTKAGDRAASILAASKFVRQFTQLIIIAAGAWLAVEQQVTGGAMIAASIIMSRALAPVEQLIGTWKQAVSARAAYRQLRAFFAAPLPRAEAMSLMPPRGLLTVDDLVFRRPGQEKPALRNIKFMVLPGETLAIVGPSGSGKSTLARLLVGVAKPSGGNVRLDSAEVFSWSRADFGRHVGYVPQDVELLEGTVRENIARWQEASPDSVISAAQAAGAHEMILRLPQGYDTNIGEDGTRLSGGERQRVALARALYGSPRFVVLDEPDASLDSDGEEALLRAMQGLKQSQATVVLVTHRRNLIAQVDRLLILKDGEVDAFGARDAVLEELNRRRAAAQQGRAAAAATGAPNVVALRAPQKSA